MDMVLLVARLALAGVFLVAGVGKLADLDGSRGAMAAFGVPARFTAVAGVALPILEILLAIGLVPIATAWWAAVGALVLLLGFLAVIGYSVAQGRAPDCHCFGQIHSEPAGPRTLVRNGVLAGVAALIVAFGYNNPGAIPNSWLGDLSGAERAGWAVAVAFLVAISGLTWVLVHIVRQNGRLLTRLDALEESWANGDRNPTVSNPAIQPGTRAPGFTLPDLDENLVSLESLRASGAPVLLVFSDPNCRACNELLPTLATWQADNRMTVAIISRGDPEANRAKVAQHGLSLVLIQKDREVALAYGADVTPSAMVIDPAGTIVSPLARGTEAIRSLVARTLPPVAMPPEAPPIGSLAPALSLPDLEGDIVSLTQLLVTRTVVLFWNPDCGYCQRLLGQLRAWELDSPGDSPNLVVVSQGAVEANRALGFRAPVLLADAGAGAPFGIAGTPGAIVVNADGTIASAVAMGAQAVLGLLNPVVSSQSRPG